MTQAVSNARFVAALNSLLDETFESVQGIYLDKGTSLFETLATITVEEASRPVSARCASIAAQVAHIRYYLDILSCYVRGERPTDVDWTKSWQIVTVTPDEWTRLNRELRESYGRVRTLLAGITDWEGDDRISGALAIVVHTAYHLGEIRQALCTVQG
ncbi:MAG TPA: DinB family protein [Thermomicrobiales bacterium]|jgi:hypothetical protein